MSLMRVVLSGVVETPPEKRSTPNNIAVCNFTLAVAGVANSRVSGLEEAPFMLKVVCWRGLADAVADQLSKGQLVQVEGRLLNVSFTAQDGSIKKNTELEASAVEILAGPSTPIVPVAQAGAGASAGTNTTKPATTSANKPVAPSPQPAYATAGVSASATGNGLDFSADDLMTEDDIPF
jgi:single-strand DNA-binding protein